MGLGTLRRQRRRGPESAGDPRPPNLPPVSGAEHERVTLRLAEVEARAGLASAELAAARETIAGLEADLAAAQTTGLGEPKKGKR